MAVVYNSLSEAEIRFVRPSRYCLRCGGELGGRMRFCNDCLKEMRFYAGDDGELSQDTSEQRPRQS